MNRYFHFLLFAMVVIVVHGAGSAARAAVEIDFRVEGAAKDGGEPVGAFREDLGYGFEGTVAARSGAEGLLLSEPVFLSVRVPEGGVRVTLEVGGVADNEGLTVKSEIRRLMLEGIQVVPGEVVTRSFIAHTRVPMLADGTAMRLRKPRETEDEARLWDDRLTLEIFGRGIAIRKVKVEPVQAPCVYLLGDSTVCDQPGSRYGSWGQMLPRFLGSGIGVANFATSGESARGAESAGRFAKVLEMCRPGDRILIQFGHNDQKSSDPEAPERFERVLTTWCGKFKAKGAVPVLVIPMHRHRFAGGKVYSTHGEYPERIRAAALASGVPVIDLAGRSGVLYEAFGENEAWVLFKHDEPRDRKFDKTHHSPYGAWLLARCVLDGLLEVDTGFRVSVAADFAPLDPARPGDPEKFKVPEGPRPPVPVPLGN